jgi:hypothetical protein
MLAFVEVFRGVLVLRRITAGHISADETHAQMHPRVAQLHALVAHVFVRCFELDLIKMGTLFRHRFAPEMKS